MEGFLFVPGFVEGIRQEQNGFAAEAEGIPKVAILSSSELRMGLPIHRYVMFLESGYELLFGLGELAEAFRRDRAIMLAVDVKGAGLFQFWVRERNVRLTGVGGGTE